MTPAGRPSPALGSAATEFAAQPSGSTAQHEPHQAQLVAAGLDAEDDSRPAGESGHDASPARAASGTTATSAATANAASRV